MTGYVIRRVLWMIPLLWAIATITFFLMHAVPGGPFDSEKPVPASVQHALDARYNLDKSILEQYGLYFWDLMHLDFGLSFRGDQDVFEILKEGFFITAQLGLIAFVVATVVGMTFGVVSALNQNGLMDYVGVIFATIGAALPNFVLAVFLTIFFSVKLGWFDVLGWEFGNYHKMVLPVVSLSVLPAAYIARVTRASMLEVLGQDYVRTARSKGLQEHVVILRHTVRNALIPVLTVLGPIFAILITGSFIIENMYGIPGIGKRFVGSVLARDYAVIMGTTLFYAIIVAFANLAVDLAYAVVDPRIRYRQG